MDSVSGGESIRALILLQMELFTNGQCLYLICSYSSLFIAHSPTPITLPSSNPFLRTDRAYVWKTQRTPWTKGEKLNDMFLFDQEGCKTVNATRCEHIRERTSPSVSVCCWKEERVATSGSPLRLELRRFAFLLHSDIWKHTVTHLVEGRRGQITVGLADRCLKQPRSMEGVKYFL